MLEREREMNRLKDEFVATVSHELRTPLSAILGWTQVLDAAGLDSAVLPRAIAAITRSAEAQARVIDDLVDVSRISTGKLRLSTEVLDLRALVSAAVDVALPLARERGLRIDAQLAGPAVFVKADADRLRQVVANLLANSLKFTDPGGRIRVTIQAADQVCDIVVEDDGVGIDPKMLPHIFDRYRQADGSTSRRFAGLGLGLAIVKDVTELHGGSVAAESGGVGKGATFRVRLPRHLPAVVPEAVPQPDPGAQARLDGVDVLVVDDNPDALDILATALRAIGADVRTASSGSVAVGEWDRKSPDILLCDLAMPAMDGFEVLAKVRERDARAARWTPAIAVTAHATPEHRVKSEQAGFAAHVIKPYRIAELVEVVTSTLQFDGPRGARR
jgi:CheY-like chemotaxis protein